MKSRIVHTILLLAGFFLFSSRSCESYETGETDYTLQQIVDIKDTGLESDYISEEAKIAFESKAKQMLRDFADYYSLYTDTKLDSLFRDNARGMLQSLFFDDSITIDVKTSQKAKVEIPTLQLFLDVSAQSDCARHQLKIHHIEVSHALMRLNETTYNGTLQFDLDNLEIIAADTISIQKASRQCEFTVVRVNKTIGQQSESIWQVFLGNIYGK